MPSLNCSPRLWSSLPFCQKMILKSTFFQFCKHPLLDFALAPRFYGSLPSGLSQALELFTPPSGIPHDSPTLAPLLTSHSVPQTSLSPFSLSSLFHFRSGALGEAGPRANGGLGGVGRSVPSSSAGRSAQRDSRPWSPQPSTYPLALDPPPPASLDCLLLLLLRLGKS